MIDRKKNDGKYGWLFVLLLVIAAIVATFLSGCTAPMLERVCLIDITIQAQMLNTRSQASKEEEAWGDADGGAELDVQAQNNMPGSTGGSMADEQ